MKYVRNIGVFCIDIALLLCFPIFPPWLNMTYALVTGALAIGGLLLWRDETCDAALKLLNSYLNDEHLPFWLDCVFYGILFAISLHYNIYYFTAVWCINCFVDFYFRHQSNILKENMVDLDPS